MSVKAMDRLASLDNSQMLTQKMVAARLRCASQASSQRRETDDWEEWEDDDVATLIDVGEHLHSKSPKILNLDAKDIDINSHSSQTDSFSRSSIDSDHSQFESRASVSVADTTVQPGLVAPPSTPASIRKKSMRQTVPRNSRRSVRRVSRPVSKRPHKLKATRFGIKLITDMSKLRRQNHIANQMAPPAVMAPKFVDVAALRALEGSPNADSVGNWNWLKEEENGGFSKLPHPDARSPGPQLSPEDRPIVIGISLLSEEVAGRGIDPLTATINNINTPLGPNNSQMFSHQQPASQTNPFNQVNQPKSVWSPDTPDTASSFTTARYTSSIYSQSTPLSGGIEAGPVPPVPALPANYKRTSQQRVKSMERRRRVDEDEDASTPCTLFEEDGNTPLKSPMSKLSAVTPDSARGWWDHHLVTPFLENTMSFASRKTQIVSPADEVSQLMVTTAKDKVGTERSLASKQILAKQIWKSPVSPEESTHTSALKEKAVISTNAPKEEDSRGFLGLSVFEGRELRSASSAKVEQKTGGRISVPATTRAEDKIHSIPSDAAVVNDSHILITLAVEVGDLPRSRNNDASKVLRAPSPLSYDKLDFEDRTVNEKPVTKKQGAGYTIAAETTGQKLDAENERGRTMQHNSTWQHVDAPILRVPTPRQTPPPQVHAVRATSERAILVEIGPKVREQAQTVLIDRAQMNSTPTIKIPTPRRTPSPCADASRKEPSSASDGANGTQTGRQEKGHELVTGDISPDHLPPYSPARNTLEAQVKYQAVFPPGYPMRNGHQHDDQSNVFHAHEQKVVGPTSGSGMKGPGASATRNERELSVPPETEQHEKFQDRSNLRRDPNLASPRGLFITMNDIEDTPARKLFKRQQKSESKEGKEPLSSTHLVSVEVAVPTLESQSRFSVSPTSIAPSVPSNGHVRGVQRKALPGVKLVKNAFSARNRNGSYSDGQRLDTELNVAQPPAMTSNENHALESLPRDPERAYFPYESQSWPDNWSRSSALPESNGRTGTQPAVEDFSIHVYNHSETGRGLKIERKRQRHEKEEVIARRAGGIWRGRGCISANGCFGRKGREGRKRRRIWVAVIGALIALILLAVVLGVVLTRHHGVAEVPSIWVNLTDYPPMPTGVLTFVGPDNTIAQSGCTEPSTLWSCSLPKDSQASVAPHKPNQPTVIFQIQWDNSTQKSWDVPNSDPPSAISQRDTGNNSTIDGFNPDPSLPAFKEMWFLGETTDDIKSNNKAGEATPFFISILKSENDTVSLPALTRRDTTQVNLTDIILPPTLEPDGTPQPAVMLPNPVQQAVRLFDRGLPTEHYGFYTYFQRTIFLKSVTVLNQTSQANVPLDEDGGCSKTEANFLVTWAETRMLVQIWTRKLDKTTSLLSPDGDAKSGNATQVTRPGTMPYPVTVTLDTHGGDPNHKVVWEWPMDNRQKLQMDQARLLANNMAVGGTWINHRGTGDAKFGGFDGGTGGCKCQWANWV